jgi:hypothetical protein
MAAITMSVAVIIAGLACTLWARMTPAERWVAWHGWGAKDDLIAASQGQARDLGWPLIDSTVVASPSGYAVVSLHDEEQTEVLFAPTTAGLVAFTKSANGQVVLPIRGPWYEIRLP